MANHLWQLHYIYYPLKLYFISNIFNIAFYSWDNVYNIYLKNA